MSTASPRVLVTGAAGFIGYHVSERLLSLGFDVVGVDNLNDYYAVSLKEARLEKLKDHGYAHDFQFIKLDISNKDALFDALGDTKVDYIINLAAQAGVRYSIENPQAYIDSNVTGFMNILELSRKMDVQHLVYASSSSVYGANSSIPFKTTDGVDHPVSIYAATKKANELMAHVYSNMYGLPTTGLRFFTVYGPWGRPDMSPMLFADAITKGQKLKVFNYGDHYRDFTYIDDIVDGVLAVLVNPPKEDSLLKGMECPPNKAAAPYRVYNIGANNPVHLLQFIETFEDEFGIDAHKEMLPMQAGDVKRTFADVSDICKEVGYNPKVDVATGVKRFVEWYKEYYANTNHGGIN